jgi:glycosyltransferase involved in cell wall biosynthesis
MEEIPFFVSVIIPCRNEEKFIGKCLDSLISQSFPKEKMEVLIVDGMSKDKTREIIKDYIKKYPFIKILDNPKIIFASATNVGIKNSKGNFIILLGAHATYSNNYVEECIRYLQENKNVDTVGGNMKSIPAENTLIAKAIVLSLGGRFGKGRQEQTRNKDVDTVFGACYRKEVFKKLGLFDENLGGSSDMDFSLRLKRSGGKIHLISNITSFYYPKTRLKDFFFHNIKDGIWAILPLKYTGRPLKARHYIPLFFFLTLPLSIWLYLPVCFYYSAKISFCENDIRLFFIMPMIFAVRHISYGLGSFLGLIKLIV